MRRLGVLAPAVAALLVALGGCATPPSQVAKPSCPAVTPAASDGRSMTRDRFYALIDAARCGTGQKALTADPVRLRAVLAELSPNEISEFVREFDDELIRLNGWSIWGAGYVANGGMSDDGFHYFRSWLIGKGRQTVDAVLDDPDSLADAIDGSYLENEELEYVGLEMIEERGLPDPLDQADRPWADDDPAGEPFDEDTVDDAYPRTAAATESSRRAVLEDLM